MNVTFVGIGAIGLPMALQIQRAGHRVTGVDLSPHARDAARESGLAAVDSFAVAPAPQVVVAMVATPQQLASLVDGIGTALDGQTWVIMSTVGPEAVREQGARLAAAGARVVDAPVTGGTARAKTGELVIFASGDAADIAAVRPVLDAMGSVRVTGPRLGDGQAIKVVNQHLCSVHIVAAAEALNLARALGLLLANGAFLLSAALFEGDWIWRMPFLMSFVMVAIGIFIRMSVSESPAFEAVKAENKVVRQPALEVIRSDWRSILKIVGLRMAETGGYYITTSFMLSYVALAHVSTTRHILWGTLLGSALGLVSHLVYGALSDKVGRRPVFMAGALFTIAFGIPMFMLINTGAIVMVIVAVALSLLFSHDPIFAVEASWFSEQFPANVRSSGISLGYNGASVIAGLLPIVATGLYGAFGWIGPALMFSLLGVVSACCALAMKETAPAVLEKRNLRQSAASRFAA